MIVVSDTSALYYAAQIDCLHLLTGLFEEIFIPDIIYAELAAESAQPFIQTLLEAQWLKTETTHNEQLVSELRKYIDAGESAAIALSIQIFSDYLLIDERKGAQIAESYGLKTIGLLSIFLLAKQAGIIPEVAAWIRKLTTRTTFRHSQKLIQKRIAVRA